MNDTTFTIVLRILLGVIVLLCTFAFAGVYVAAGIKSDSKLGRSRYTLLGGALGFLFGVSAGGLMLMDTPDTRVLPIVLVASLVCGLGGAYFVFDSAWSSTWWRRYLKRRTDSKTEEDTE